MPDPLRMPYAARRGGHLHNAFPPGGRCRSILKSVSLEKKENVQERADEHEKAEKEQ